MRFWAFLFYDPVNGKLATQLWVLTSFLFSGVESDSTPASLAGGVKPC